VDQQELPLKHISQYAPFYEIDPHWEPDSDQLVSKIREAHEALGYRLFNTHLLWDMLPKTNTTSSSSTSSPMESAKYIYLVRDGRDTLTSFYHHMTNQHPDDGGYEGDFEAFFQDFLEGKIAYGKWQHHLASWMPQIFNSSQKKDNDEQGNPSQILLVRYEDLKKDMKEQVVRLAKFLQLESLMEDANKNNETGDGSESFLLQRVLERSSFQWMRKHQELFHPISVRWKPGYNFIRSGSIGDHDTIFDEEHKKKFVDSVIADLADEQGQVPAWLSEYGFHGTLDLKN
jgi:hypothetical protein